MIQQQRIQQPSASSAGAMKSQQQFTWSGLVRATRGKNWFQRLEHPVLRVVALMFSFWSAHAIRWIFSPLDGIDTIEPAMIWAVAVAFGLLGFFVSRGIVYRLMHKESWWSYIPICFVVEFVEIVANYSEAASNIEHATWIRTVPVNQQVALTFLTYAMYCIIPFGSLFLAVVDMDMLRKNGASAHPNTGATQTAAQPPVQRPTPTGQAGTTVQPPVQRPASNRPEQGMPLLPVRKVAAQNGQNGQGQSPFRGSN